MSEVLDDQPEDKIRADLLGLVRVLALAFLAKSLADLFFRLQAASHTFSDNYVMWVLVGVQLMAVQRAVYAFYRCKDGRLIAYLRFFYLSLGLFLLVIASMDTNIWPTYLYPYYFEDILLLVLDSAVALLLIRYYVNRKEQLQYWQFMEKLIQLCLGIILVYKLVYWSLYNQPFEFFLEWVFLWSNGSMSLFVIVILLYAVRRTQTIPKRDKWLAFLSLLAVMAWKLGMYFEHHYSIVVELLLFAGATLAVLAYASSFNKPTNPN
ncbi:MAG: hypothetical protein AB8E82_13225 [Aureispira sp.]